VEVVQDLKLAAAVSAGSVVGALRVPMPVIARRSYIISNKSIVVSNPTPNPFFYLQLNLSQFRASGGRLGLLPSELSGYGRPSGD
jgi:hypothetical protein